MDEIELGDKVRCKVTGFEGIATSRIEFLNGCVQYGVAPKIKEGENKMPEEVGIDSQSLEVIEEREEDLADEDVGGAMTRGISQRGF